MNEANKVWVAPESLDDMAPLPALLYDGSGIALYDRKAKTFGEVIDFYPAPAYDTFEQCRLAMIGDMTEALSEAHDHARRLAIAIEHVRTIPTASFPNVQREVREQEGQQEEGQEQQVERRQEAQAEEVKPAPKPELKRPARKSNG